MTEDISEEELLLIKQGRRRLVGAVALVIAAIIILPLIFDEEPEVAQQEIAIRYSPEKTSVDQDTILQPTDKLNDNNLSEEVIEELDDMDESLDSLGSLSVQSAASEETVVDPIKEIGTLSFVPVPKAKPVKKSNTNNELASANIDQQSVSEKQEFVVQLGAFSDHAKATHQQQSLVSHGIEAYTETSSANNKQMMRVRVGPFSSRSAAESELMKLRKMGLDGVVTAK